MMSFLFWRFDCDISVDCTSDSDCNSGQNCQDNVCTCSQDFDCEDTQSCQNGKCQKVSCDNLSCGTNAVCVISNNGATCECESGYFDISTPEEGCVECTEVSHCTNGQTCHYKKCSMSCTQDSDCADTESCKTGQCENVNCDQLSCGSNAQCVIANHAATCQCNSGYHTATTADDGCCKFYNSQTPVEQYFDSYL